jgi:hypothetical protein
MARAPFNQERASMSRTTTTGNGRKNRRTFRERNHPLEYARRIAKGEAEGKSRSASRGHARAKDLPKRPPGSIDRSSPVEQGLKLMRGGVSQKAAAKAAGVSVEKLRLHRELNTASRFVDGKWDIFDTRPQAFRIASEGEVISVTLPNDDGSTVSAYWRAVDAFILSNDEEVLHPFEGEGVFDVRSRFHQFETRPNVLRKLEAMGDLNFIDIYDGGGGV